MSLYNANVKTWQIDPQFHSSNRRDVFRLDRGYEALFYSTLRILNIGVVTDKIQTPYNYLVGAHGAIKNIYLMDGKRVLSSMVDVRPYMGFLNQLKPNSSEMDVDKILKRHGLGYCLNRENPVGAEFEPAKITEWFPNAPKEPTTSESTTPMAYLDLKSVFPMLRSVEFLHTGIFADLQVVIEYDTSKALVLDQEGTPSVVLNTTSPVLCVDEVLSKELADKVMREFKGVVWNEIENEKVSLGQAELKKTWQLLGANNKTVDRILIVKTPTGTNGSQLYRNCGSQVMVGEDFQLVINGSQLMSNQQTRPNMLLGLQTDTYGNAVCHSASNDLPFYGAVDRFEDDFNARVGALGYFACTIGQAITKNIQLTYTREARAGGNAVYLIPLVINVYYEVAKEIVKTKDGYNVLYV